MIKWLSWKFRSLNPTEFGYTCGHLEIDEILLLKTSLEAAFEFWKIKLTPSSSISTFSPYRKRWWHLNEWSPEVKLLVSSLMQCANKNTWEKGHNFEPRNPPVLTFRVLFRWHIPAKRIVILNIKIPVFRVLIQKCIPAIKVHFILKSCDIIVELLGHLSVL